MPDRYKDKWMWDDGTGIALEGTDGVWVLDVPPVRFNNYMSVKAGDGMSVTEHLR